MTKSNTLFIVPVLNIEIDEDLGDGIEIGNNLHITNDSKFIKSLLSDYFAEVVGHLEYNSLVGNTDCVIYSIKEVQINDNNKDDVYFKELIEAFAFVNDLWMIKDHSAEITLGFLEFPYQKPSKHIITPIPLNSVIHSNSLSLTSHILANGTSSFSTYSVKEIKKAITYGESRVVIFKNSSGDYSEEISSRNSRTFRAYKFLQIARAMTDLGVRIANYCSALECLFASGNGELKDKLSIRVACFLVDSPLERKELYQKIGNAYKIRSRIIHGDVISKSQEEMLVETSTDCDNILRQIMIKLHDNPELDKFYRRVYKNKKKEEMEQEFNNYFLNLQFGLKTNMS